MLDEYKGGTQVIFPTAVIIILANIYFEYLLCALC